MDNAEVAAHKPCMSTSTNQKRNASAGPGTRSSDNDGGYAPHGRPEADDVVGAAMVSETGGYDFVAGDQLPTLDLGAQIDIDGAPYWCVRDADSARSWVDEHGVDVGWPLSAYDFNIVTAEPEADEQGTVQIATAALETGDVVYVSETGTPLTGKIGTVSKVVLEAEKEMRVEFSEGRRQFHEVGALLRVLRPENTAAYDVNSNDYWANVRATSSPRTDVETLAQIVTEQSEDDFMAAAIANPNATMGIIDAASKHNSLHVKRLAVFHPLTSEVTLKRIRRRANFDSKASAALLKEQGISPDTQYHRSQIKANDDLAAAASQQLGRRARA